MLQSMRSMAKWIWIGVAVVFVGGFLLYETSGLVGRSRVTVTTAVASVEGTDIPWQQWQATAMRLAQQQEQQMRRSLTLDERARIDDRAFEQLVGDILLQKEYEKRGIRVTDAELVDAAQYAPPEQFQRSPELQTDGRFDIEKYRRLLASPAARQQGILINLENYYREEIPRQKLFFQLAGETWVSDEHLWSTWQDTHDSATVTWVGWDPTSIPDGKVTVSDAEISDFFAKNAKRFDRPGRAVVSVVKVPRTVTAADSEAVRARIAALRAEITSGKRTFEDAAKELSADSGSGAQGGDLGKSHKDRYVKAFSDAAAKLSPKEISGPVLSEFGYHLIRLDERKGDTLALHHILLAIKQSDSSATRSDRRADSLAAIAASQDKPARFDSAVKVLGLKPEQLVATEGDPLIGKDGKYVPSVSAWAFGGVRVGETSELYDADDAYYLARLDSVRVGGKASLETVKDEIRTYLARGKKLALLADSARAFAKAAAAGGFEAAAKARGLSVGTAGPFTRVSSVNGLGQATEAIGAAFALPVGGVSGPITTRERVIVLRVDKRVAATREAWAAQKAQQRDAILQALRQTRVREYLDHLRKTANVKDHRKEIQSANRQATS
ncbi:MAG: peptidyl-prolyl cis-trans isomerase [Gemmatimonadetes bacterium]|nr:peptidyl-prolyl cis-trans isomerase [Gemmatimonadota bacterium]